MIDFKQELENYPPIDLAKLLEMNPDMPDNLKNSIALYNKALDNFRTKSEDIAIIELRKAISINPDFHEAINLLGVFYTSTGDYTKAKETFERVINEGKTSIKALEYIKDLDPDYNQPGNVKKKHKDKKEGNKAKDNKDNKGIKKDNKKNIKKAPKDFSGLKKKLSNIAQYMEKDWVKYVIGFTLGALLVFLLSFRFYSGSPAVDAVNDIDDKTPVVDNKEDYEQKYNQLNDDYKSLLLELDEFKKKTEYYRISSELLEVDKMVSENNYIAAADKLTGLKDVELEGIEKEKYESLRKAIMPKAAWEMFAQGRELLQNKKYQEALGKLDRVLLYVDEWKYLNVTLYYRGVCYQSLGINDKALEAFDEVISKYPSSSYATYSRNRINQINAES